MDLKQRSDQHLSVLAYSPLSIIVEDCTAFNDSRLLDQVSDAQYLR